MATIRNRWRELWDTISSSPTFVPTRIDFPAPAAKPFESGKHYFQIRVNRLFLANGRQWLSTYDPLVFAVTDVLYDKELRSVPFVIGPSLVQKEMNKINVPHGIVLANVHVAGPFPYRGGRLALTVVLCAVRRDNYLSKMLKLVESMATTLASSTPVASYMKLGQVVLDGVESLFGSSDTRPLAGLRTEYDPDAGDVVTEGHHALINQKCDPAKFSVKNDELYYGDSPDNAAPFTGADYVLYEITRSESRSDETNLPFYLLHDQVIAEAARGGDQSWERAKANMLALWQQLALSPDLIPAQRDSLSSKYRNEMIRLRDEAKGIESMDQGHDRQTQDALDEAVKVLDL